MSAPVDWLGRIAPLLDEYTASSKICRCTPGFSSLDEDRDDGRVHCEECGLLMLASTVGELVRRHQAQAAACPPSS